jgi:hypothetical protein
MVHVAACPTAGLDTAMAQEPRGFETSSCAGQIAEHAQSEVSAPRQGDGRRRACRMFRVIAAMRDESTSVLLVEQNVGAAVAVADPVFVLSDGR